MTATSVSTSVRSIMPNGWIELARAVHSDRQERQLCALTGSNFVVS